MLKLLMCLRVVTPIMRIKLMIEIKLRGRWGDGTFPPRSQMLSLRLFEPLRDAGLPAVITEPEHTRRIDDMMKLYGIATSGANYKQNREVMLTLNTNNALINRICRRRRANIWKISHRHIWSLARLTRGSLTPDEMGAFLPKAIRF